MGGLLVLSALFSGTETALFSLTPEAARQLRRHSRTRRLLAIFEKTPSELLTALLFGNLVVNVIFFCTGASLAGQWEGPSAYWIDAAGGALILLAVILFGEIIPKAAGINHGAGVLQMTAPALHVWFWFTRPFRRMVRVCFRLLHLPLNASSAPASLTPGELKELIDAVRHEPGFGSQEKEILEDIVNLSDIRVREIMVPRVQVLRKPVRTDRQRLLEDARQREHSLILIYRESEDNPLGYVRIRDLAFQQPSARSLEPLIRPLTFIPETCRADVLLDRFMKEGFELAAVVDEYGGLAGVITPEEILQEIVGDFEQEPSAQIERLDENTYRLSGQLPIRAWHDLFTGFLSGQEIDALTFDTLGGLLISLLGRMPHPGDRVSLCNLSLTVESMHHRRIGTVLLHLTLPEERS